VTKSRADPGPLVTVIVASYGRPQFLGDALDSVLGQTVDDLECIVVDDGSPDLPVVPEHPKVRLVVRSRNGGQGAARNTGLEQARGRYVTFLDDDDMYTPDRLAIGLEAMRPGVDITFCWLRPFATPEEAASPPRVRGHGNRILTGDAHDRILDRGRTHLGQALLRREVVPRFDERFRCAEDLEWWIRASRGVTVDTVPKFGYLKRRHGDPSQTRRLMQRIDCRFFLMELYEEYFRSHPLAAARQWREIGEVAYGLGDYRYARAAFRRSLRLNPLNRPAWQLMHLFRSARPARGAVRVEDLSSHRPPGAPLVIR
jgi:glycosyltransferase involved in cell wall biosynthesis